jgi:hypothetical protein
MTTIEDRTKIAKSVNGILGYGTLNWMGDYSMEFKRPCYSIFFNKKTKAEKAMMHLAHLNPKLLTTPTFINMYFKYSLFILD